MIQFRFQLHPILPNHGLGRRHILVPIVPGAAGRVVRYRDTRPLVYPTCSVPTNLPTNPGTNHGGSGAPRRCLHPVCPVFPRQHRTMRSPAARLYLGTLPNLEDIPKKASWRWNHSIIQCNPTPPPQRDHPKRTTNPPAKRGKKEPDSKPRPRRADTRHSVATGPNPAQPPP